VIGAVEFAHVVVVPAIRLAELMREGGREGRRDRRRGKRTEGGDD